MPAALESLVERLRALQHATESRDQVSVVEGPGGLAIDLEARRVCVNDDWVATSRLEFDFLVFLLNSRGTVISTREIAESVWGYRAGGSTNYIETRVSRLRSKLRRAGLDDLIENVRGVGYVIR